MLTSEKDKGWIEYKFAVDQYNNACTEINRLRGELLELKSRPQHVRDIIQERDELRKIVNGAIKCETELREEIQRLRGENSNLLKDRYFYHCMECDELRDKLALAENVISKSKQILMHWCEFGPLSGFEESIDNLEKALTKIGVEK